MMLAAHSMGLGTVWINQLKDTCGDAGVRKLLTAFGVPEDHDVYACCAIGTPWAGPKRLTGRRAPRRLWNKLSRGKRESGLESARPQTACKEAWRSGVTLLRKSGAPELSAEKTESLPVRECLLAFRRLIAGRHGIG